MSRKANCGEIPEREGGVRDEEVDAQGSSPLQRRLYNKVPGTTLNCPE